MVPKEEILAYKDKSGFYMWLYNLSHSDGIISYQQPKREKDAIRQLNKYAEANNETKEWTEEHAKAIREKGLDKHARDLYNAEAEAALGWLFRI